MAAVRKSDRPQDLGEFQTDMALVKYQIEAMVKQGNRQEEKIDQVKATLDALSTVSRHEFDDYKDSINVKFEALDRRYVKLESTKAVRAVALAVAIALATAVVLALAKLVGPTL